jgi:hypothetical protein
MAREVTASTMAAEVAALLAAGDEVMARRVLFRFVELVDRALPSARPAMVDAAPAPIGDRRLDALLAASVEDSCSRHGLEVPSWVNADRFFLEQFWFVAGVAALEADAMLQSPISFRRRGVFLNEASLSSA